MTGDVVGRLLAGDPTLFEGSSASHSLGWLEHPGRYLGSWLDDVDATLPRRHPRTLLLGMGGSSSGARLYVEAHAESNLRVIDTTHPDTVATIEFEEATVVASSKSGTTVETLALLAHALANGLDPRDLVVVSDPGTTLTALAESLGATVIAGDPEAGGRFSALSPFALVPALLAGWSPATLRGELADAQPDAAMVESALAESTELLSRVQNGWCFLDLGADPLTSGGALWLEQLIAETTGKSGCGVVPVPGTGGTAPRVGDVQRHHLVAALLARGLGVDPFDQPDVDAAKRDVFALLSRDAQWHETPVNLATAGDALAEADYVAIQVFAPLDAADDVVALRERVARLAPATANLGPRYLHSTGQLHKGGPAGVVALQVVVRPRSTPVRVKGRHFTFHDLVLAQARSDLRAMRASGRVVVPLVVDQVSEAASMLHLAP